MNLASAIRLCTTELRPLITQLDLVGLRKNLHGLGILKKRGGRNQRAKQDFLLCASRALGFPSSTVHGHLIWKKSFTGT